MSGLRFNCIRAKMKRCADIGAYIWTKHAQVKLKTKLFLLKKMHKVVT